MNYFSRDELLMGREVQYPISQEQEDNLSKLIEALNQVRAAYGKPMSVSSGYRPAAINAATAGSAKHSAHMDCQAADIHDADGKLAEWALDNLDLIKSCGIKGIEDPRYTIIVDSQGNRVGGWVHFDIRGAASGKLVFIPYAGPIKLQVR